MATIEKRNGKYRVRIRIKDVNLSETFERKADAVAWAAKTESEIRDGLRGNAGRNLFFADVLKRYAVEITPAKRGARSETYRINRAAATFLADVRLTDLKAEHFAKWRDMRLGEVAPDSVRRELETLSAVCDYAVKEWGLLQQNPVMQINRPKKGAPRNYIPSDAEVSAVLSALGYADGVPIVTTSQRVALAVLFALETAMRAGEICNLTWEFVYPDRRVAHLTMTKNGSSRDVPLSRKAMAVLDKLPRFDGSDSVFNLTAASLDVIFRRARNKAGADNFHFHDTRHKALTRMADKVEPMQLAKISGHKDLRTLLNVYYNPDIGKLADLLD